MIRKVAIAVGALVLLVVVAWLLVPAPASSDLCKFEPKPYATFHQNHLQLSFAGHYASSLTSGLRRSWFGAANDDGCGLAAQILFEGPIEPGTFTAEGEAELSGLGWTFKPANENHPKIKLAAVKVSPDFGVPSFSKLWVSGTVSIERVDEREIVGRLQLRSDGDGGGRVSAPFIAIPRF